MELKKIVGKNIGCVNIRNINLFSKKRTQEETCSEL